MKKSSHYDFLLLNC